MGNTDSIPVISQAKSAVQGLAGDHDAARTTQKNFVRGCPIISQGLALGAVIAGDTKFAKESQIYFVKGISNLADGIPIVGHVKGGIHYICGDSEGGSNAIKASSRSVGVACGAIGGFILAGPVGAIAGGIGGGAAMDGIITGVESAVEGEYTHYGHVAFVTNAIDGNLKVGDVFDWAVGIAFDGLAGRGYAKAYNNITSYIKAKRSNKIQMATLREVLRQAVENNELKLTEVDSINSLSDGLSNAAKTLDNARLIAGDPNIKSILTVVIDVEGNEHVGFNFKLREAAGIESFQGEVPSAQHILNETSGRVPILRGALAGESSCAEVHAVHKFHKQNGMAATPAKTITVGYSTKTNGYVARARCENCQKVGEYVNMGNVVTDGINGAQIPLPFEGNVGAASAILSSEVLHCCTEDLNESDGNDLPSTLRGALARNWNDDSPEWNRVSQEEKNRIGLIECDDGELWFEFKEFETLSGREAALFCLLNPQELDEYKELISIYVKSFEDWRENHIDGYFGPNCQHIFKVDKEGGADAVISLSTLAENYGLPTEEITCGFLLFKLKDEDVVKDPFPPKHFVSQQFDDCDDYDDYNCGRLGEELNPSFKKLEPGTYCLKVFTKKIPTDSRKGYALRIMWGNKTFQPESPGQDFNLNTKLC